MNRTQMALVNALRGKLSEPQTALNLGTRVATTPLYPVSALAEAIRYWRPDMETEDFVGTQEWAQRKLGGDPQASENIVADFATPDPMDAAKVAKLASTFDPSMAMTLLHGTGHKFDEFDISKIGSGEGSQAYGHGLYFAENPEVASSYARQVARKMAEPVHDLEKTKEIALTRLERQKSQIKTDPFWTNVNEREAQQHYLNQIDRQMDEVRAADDVTELVKRIRSGNLVEHDDLLRQGKEYLYEVDIPDEAIDQFLDLDELVDEQNPEVLEKLKAQPWWKWGEEYDWNAWAADNPTGQHILRYLEEDGPEYAADALREAGILGTKFYDRSSRRGQQGTRNFVSFYDDLVTPLKRNEEVLAEQLRKP